MDTFEPIRQAAVELHGRVVARGVDPLSPPALIADAVRLLDLELIELVPGDPALKNARALFDEQSGTICCEAEGTTAARAVLVAHEIGHAQLHAGSTACAAEEIDPSRSTEAAPVGLQKVEDYGARERRELQANVFARELVLPRHVVRRLHVDEGWTATRIADHTGLPKALVRQQLFDALLLPTFSDAGPGRADAPSLPPRPDPSQDRAAGHRHKPFLLEAGPGTGKTRTLVKRVKWLIDDGVDPAAMVVLTFSNRAAGELAERLAAAVPDAAARIWVGTFHAFGLDLVRRHHDRLGLPPNPPLFDRSDAIEVLEEILPTLPLVHYRNLWDPAMVLREIVGAIGRAKDELAGPARYRELAEAMQSAAADEAGRTAAAKCLEIAAVYDLYESALRVRGAVDFGDLIMRPALLLEADPALRLEVQLRHRHVLVDEYQDVNRASARLLKAIAGDGGRLWVVGDARQSIYRFRGASSANMARFGVDYAGAVYDALGVNYRSTREIVDTVTAIASRMGASGSPLKLVADRGAGPSKPEVRRYETPDDEAAGVAGSVRELEARGVPLRDQAVLCRSNGRLNDIAAALEARGIPVLHLGSLFERDEVRDLLALLHLSVDKFGVALVRVGAMPRYGLSLQDVYAATRALSTGNQTLAALTDAAEVSPEGRLALARLAADLKELLHTRLTAWDFLATYLLDRTRLAAELSQTETVAGRMRAVAVWQFLNFVRDQGPLGKTSPIHRTLDRVRQLVLLAEERDLRQVPAAALHMDAVRLMTVHGSKGLEFEAVHVPGLTVSSFPSSNRGQRCPPPRGMIEGTEGLSVSEAAKKAQEDEEECLFFVAISRARTHVRLHLARKQSGGKNRTASPFIGWLPPALCDEVADPVTLVLPAGGLLRRAIAVTIPPDWSVTGGRLALYDRCPRRFFYSHVLGLGGRRKPTAFTDTHDCLHALIRWLADARRTSEPSLADTEAAFEAIWKKQGPRDHAFAAEYRLLASRLIATLVQAGTGRRFRVAQPIALSLSSGTVMVEPDELADLPDGKVAVRRVQTGYRRTDEYDRLEYSLYHLAAQATLGAAAVVEALHLTDGIDEPVTLSPNKLAARRERAETMLADITAGQFPPQVDAVSCPRCPHFFACAATPEGTLKLA